MEGDALADEGAGLAASESLSWRRLGEADEADRWGATAALVRSRARRAMELATEQDPWSGERAAKERSAPTTAISRALAASAHAFLQTGSKFRCSSCELIVPASRLVTAASTPCPGRPVSREIGAGARGSCVAGREVHPTHKVHYWSKYALSFCTACGKYATLDGRHLATRCLGSSRKGRENLSRIEQGLYPRREGVPARLQEVLEARGLG